MSVLSIPNARPPRLSVRRLLACAGVAMSALLAAPAAQAQTGAELDPVIMIPGMGGLPYNMTPMETNLANNGWSRSRLFTWTDADQMNKDMEVSARAISAKVDEVLRTTGASKVVLATWSASTIASRYYIKYLGGDKKVSQYIAFAGPHHGITRWTSCLTTQTACRNQWGPIPNTPWLNELNSGTEVPGWPNVRYLTLRGSNDIGAHPVDTAMLQGADENLLFNGLDHNTIITDAAPLAAMRTFIKKWTVRGPAVTACSATPSGTSATVSATGNESNGPIVSYRVRLTGPTGVDDVASVAGASFSKAYPLADGLYTGTVTATDSQGRVSNACEIPSFRVGAGPVTSGHDPVIIGTGMSGDLTKMEPIRKMLVDNGWKTDRVILWKDSTGFAGDVPTTAKELSAKVDEVLRTTGASKVVLIGWSSSSISFRYYIKNLGGTAKVSQYIGIAGPQHGISTYQACALTSPACAQWGPPNGPFITALNATTEVPGNAAVENSTDVDYLTIRGSADGNATPVDTAILNGADENALYAGLTHYTLLTNAAVHAKIREFITAHESPSGGGTGVPTALGVTGYTANSVALSWGGVTGATGYNVYRSASPTGPWTRVNTSLVTGTSFNVTGLATDTRYYFMVRAQKTDGTETGDSNVVTQVTSGTGTTPYTQKVTATVYAHYTAGRITTTQYNTLGARYGYTMSVTLYLCGTSWTDKANCAPL